MIFKERFFIESLRALYLGDNCFERLPNEIGNLTNLQIVRMKIFDRGNGSYNAISAIYGNTSVIFDVSR